MGFPRLGLLCLEECLARRKPKRERSGKGFVCHKVGREKSNDIAVAESFFSTLKTQLDYRYESRSIARQSIFEYIEVFYNRIRRHSSLNYMSPLEYERKHVLA